MRRLRRLMWTGMLKDPRGDGLRNMPNFAELQHSIIWICTVLGLVRWRRFCTVPQRALQGQASYSQSEKNRPALWDLMPQAGVSIGTATARQHRNYVQWDHYFSWMCTRTVVLKVESTSTSYIIYQKLYRFWSYYLIKKRIFLLNNIWVCSFC